MKSNCCNAEVVDITEGKAIIFSICRQCGNRCGSLMGEPRHKDGGKYSENWTVRDELAASASVTYINLENGSALQNPSLEKMIAEASYRMADAMLKEREK